MTGRHTIEPPTSDTKRPLLRHQFEFHVREVDVQGLVTRLRRHTRWTQEPHYGGRVDASGFRVFSLAGWLFPARTNYVVGRFAPTEGGVEVTGSVNASKRALAALGANALVGVGLTLLVASRALDATSARDAYPHLLRAIVPAVAMGTICALQVFTLRREFRRAEREFWQIARG